MGVMIEFRDFNNSTDKNLKYIRIDLFQKERAFIKPKQMKILKMKFENS